ncbi:MAG: alkaline phosphatase family protein [Chloroflexota bacterium]
MERAQLEKLFDRGLLSRGQFVAGLAGLGVTAAGLERLLGVTTGPVDAQTDTAQYFCLIVLDAFRPDYMQMAPMPHLEALGKRGTSYDFAWVAQLESETPTGHATLSTGSVPRNDGIIGFEWRDPKSGKEARDGWPPGVLAGDMERDLRASGADSIPLAIKAADPAAKVATMSSEKVYAADAMGGWAADYIFYHHRTATHLVPRAVPGHEPPAEFFRRPKLSLKLPRTRLTNWDYLSTMLALAALADFKPRALMVNMPGCDFYGHPYGGPASPKVMGTVAAGIDRNIGRIVQAYQAAGISDQTLFVVTADHGMVPNDRAVPGSTTMSTVKHNGGQYLFHTGGTAADIYLKNRLGAQEVAAAMARVPNVAASYYQTLTNGAYSYELSASSSIPSDLDDAYRYLLSTFSGPTAPDVVAPFRENTIGSAEKTAHGDHGGLNWGAQHIPLFIAGPGVRPGATSHFPARLEDVAPTVLQLLGLASPDMDGTVLADCLGNASAAQVSAQEALRGPLTAHQAALITQAETDIAQDQKAGIHPPPALPMKP